MKINDVLYQLYNSYPVNSSEAVKLVNEGPKDAAALKKEAEEDGWVPVFITRNGIDLTLHYTTPWNRRMLYRKPNHKLIGLREGAPVFFTPKAR